MAHERTLKIKVTPRAPRSEIAGTLSDGTLKVRLAAPPERGRANRELIELLAREYNVRPENVAILSGATATTKLVRITS